MASGEARHAAIGARGIGLLAEDLPGHEAIGRLVGGNPGIEAFEAGAAERTVAVFVVLDPMVQAVVPVVRRGREDDLAGAGGLRGADGMLVRLTLVAPPRPRFIGYSQRG